MSIIRNQKGFTLVELLAVVAIIGILVAIVVPAVSGVSEAGKDAQSKQDGTSVDSAASDFFKEQVAAEVLSLETADVTAGYTDADGVTGLTEVTSTIQKISSRWPELYITGEGPESSTAVYLQELPTTDSDTTLKVTKLTIIGLDGAAITEDDLLEGYTAIDFDVLTGVDTTDLRASGYLQKNPKSVDSVSTSGGIGYHNFLWLFKKQTSAGGSDDNDFRKVTVFKLVSIQEAEGDDTVQLTFEQIF